LPQKKSKLKGQKQPKQLPVQQQHSNAPEPQQQHQQQQQQPLMTSLAAVPQSAATGNNSNS